MNWKAIVGIGILLVVVSFGSAWFWQDARWTKRLETAPKDTVTEIRVAPHVLPPAVVTPNPAPAHTVPDPILKARVDSLIAKVADKDSLIQHLMSTKGTEQQFVSKDPIGLDISGELVVLYSPIENHFLTRVNLDTVRVPEKFTTITQTVVDERFMWEPVAIAGAVGCVVGALLMSGAR